MPASAMKGRTRCATVVVSARTYARSFTLRSFRGATGYLASLKPGGSKSSRCGPADFPTLLTPLQSSGMFPCVGGAAQDDASSIETIRKHMYRSFMELVHW